MDGHDQVGDGARRSAARRVEPRPEAALARRAVGQQPCPDRVQHRRRADHDHAAAGALHAGDPVHRRAERDRRRRHGRHGLPGPGRPQRHVGRGARPPQGEGAGLRGVPQAPQRDPGPGSRQRPHAAQRPHARVPRRGSAARRHARRGDGPRLPRQPGRAGRVGPQALRRQRAGARPPVSSSNVDQRTLREIYTLPVRGGDRPRRPGGVMCPFNQVNGVWACENANTSAADPQARDRLRRLGRHRLRRASLPDRRPDVAARPGWTRSSTAGGSGPRPLKAALAAGTITQAQIDEAAFRVVRAHIRDGLFDDPLPATPAPVVTSPAHQAIAREVAEKGSVLLKNDRALPLTGKARRSPSSARPRRARRPTASAPRASAAPRGRPCPARRSRRSTPSRRAPAAR